MPTILVSQSNLAESVSGCVLELIILTSLIVYYIDTVVKLLFGTNNYSQRIKIVLLIRSSNVQQSFLDMGFCYF